jgi:hypothetical protein
MRSVRTTIWIAALTIRLDKRRRFRREDLAALQHQRGLHDLDGALADLDAASCPWTRTR